MSDIEIALRHLTPWVLLVVLLVWNSAMLKADLAEYRRAKRIEQWRKGRCK